MTATTTTAATFALATAAATARRRASARHQIELEGALDRAHSMGTQLCIANLRLEMAEEEMGRLRRELALALALAAAPVVVVDVVDDGDKWEVMASAMGY